MGEPFPDVGKPPDWFFMILVALPEVRSEVSPFRRAPPSLELGSLGHSARCVHGYRNRAQQGLRERLPERLQLRCRLVCRPKRL
jgi:hypothetical protein